VTTNLRGGYPVHAGSLLKRCDGLRAVVKSLLKLPARSKMTKSREGEAPAEPQVPDNRWFAALPEPRPRVFNSLSGCRGILIAVALLVPGCSAPTEVDRDNRRLLDAILTAITMQNLAWLEEDAKLAEERHEDGHLTDTDYEELVSIIEAARSGDWKAAERQGYDFRKRRPFVKEGR